MAIHAADTSFLLSYYGKDANTDVARAALVASTSTLQVHALNDFEFGNALRALVFRRMITNDRAAAWLADYHADMGSGVIAETHLDANLIIRRGLEISESRTEISGNRSYDILLVAAAKILAATHFWSFDVRQRNLAAEEGLIVLP